MTFECPECGKEFEEKRSRGTHWRWCRGTMEPPMKGKSHSEETKKKMSEAAEGRSFTEEHKKNLSEGQTGCTKNFTEEHKKNISKALKGKMLSEKHKNEISKTVTEHWKEEEYIEKVTNGWTSDKTKLEKKAESIIEELDLDFEFVGDFSYSIGKKCPDFINEEEKEVIEVYSISEKKWRKNLDSIDEYKQPRRQYFNERGWTVHFIPSKTLRKDLEALVNGS